MGLPRAGHARPLQAAAYVGGGVLDAPQADVSIAPTRRLYFFASLPATKPDRQLMTSTSTSSTTAVP